MIYRMEEIDGGYRYWWPDTEEVRAWLDDFKISFERYPRDGELMHDVFDARTATLIKLAWGGA